MEWVLTTGKSLEDAKDAALDELGVDEADAEFEILEQPRQGLFGRVRGEARVRARVRPTAPRPKLDWRDKRRKNGEAARLARAAPATRNRAEVPSDGPSREPVPAVARSEGGPTRRRRARRGPDEGSAGPLQPAAQTQDGEQPSPGPRTSVSGRSISKDKELAVSEDTLTLVEQGELAREFLVGLMASFGAPSDISVADVGDDTLEVRVTGPDLGLLVGPKGATLAAVQDLTRTVVQRRTPSRSGRLVVDVAGYRQRRRAALERFTRQVAADVIAAGVAKALEAMTAADRKVVHDTATQIQGVRTLSEGEEPRRRVVILPEGGSTESGQPAG
jgi:spoIIIJ-associated protein